MKNSFVFTIKNFNNNVKKTLDLNLKELGKNKNFEFIILSCSNDQQLNLYIDKNLCNGFDLKYYRPLKDNVTSALIKNFYLKLADNKFITFLSETAIINTYFLLNLSLLKGNKILFADDNRFGLFLTAHRDTFLKLNGFDISLFSTSLNVEDDDFKNRIVFSRAAEPVILDIEKIAYSQKVILNCDKIVASVYDNYTSFKNISTCRYILPTLNTANNIVLNNELTLN